MKFKLVRIYRYLRHLWNDSEVWCTVFPWKQEYHTTFVRKQALSTKLSPAILSNLFLRIFNPSNMDIYCRLCLTDLPDDYENGPEFDLLIDLSYKLLGIKVCLQFFFSNLSPSKKSLFISVGLHCTGLCVRELRNHLAKLPWIPTRGAAKSGVAVNWIAGRAGPIYRIYWWFFRDGYILSSWHTKVYLWYLWTDNHA